MALYHKSYYRPPVAYNLTKLSLAKAILNDAFFGEAIGTKVEDTEIEQLRLTKPKIWNINIEGNEELEMETGFEKFIFLVQEHTTVDIDNISFFRFHSLLDYIKEKNVQDGR